METNALQVHILYGRENIVNTQTNIAMRTLIFFFALVFLVKAASVNEIFNNEFRDGLDRLRHTRKHYPALYLDEMIDALKPFLKYDWPPLLAEIARATDLPKIIGEHIKGVCHEDTQLLNYHDKHFHAFLRYTKALYIACADRSKSDIKRLTQLGLEVIDYIDLNRLQYPTRDRVEKAKARLQSIYKLALVDEIIQRPWEKSLPVVQFHNYIKSFLAEACRRLKRNTRNPSNKPLSDMFYDLAKLDWAQITWLTGSVRNDPAIKELSTKLRQLSGKKWEMTLHTGKIKNLTEQQRTALRIVDDIFKIVSEDFKSVPPLLKLLSDAADALFKARDTLGNEDNKVAEILKKWIPQVTATLTA